MFGNWFNSKSGTIGIDVGRSAVKLAQVATDGGAARLIASTSVEVPAAQRSSSAGPLEVFQQSVDDALARNGFRGRRVVLGLPASYVHIDRLRLPASLSDEQVREAVVWESIDKLPFHPSRAMMRHLVAGQVYENDEQRHEVIVMAVRQEVTERLLAAAARAKLDVVGIRPEPLALVEGFGRADESTAGHAGRTLTRAIVDIGHGATRLYVACGARVEFARAIGIGWQHLDPRKETPSGCAGAEEQPDGRACRNPLPAAPARPGGATAVLTPPAPTAPPADAGAAAPLRRLVSELRLSLHYHGETFPSTSIEDVVFVGGASCHRGTVQQIAATMGLPARAGDPLTPARRGGAKPGDDAPARPEMAVAISLSLATPDGDR